MRKDIAGPERASTTPTWDTLERMVREKAQEFIQHILEEKVTELLGRGEVGAASGGRCAGGLPQRLRQAATAGDELGHDHGPATEGTRCGGAVREPGAAVVRSQDEGGRGIDPGAVPARTRRRGLRARPQGAFSETERRCRSPRSGV